MKFTCVIPVLNQKKYILSALQSLEAQKAADLEVIVMDGGSIDGTVDVLKEFKFSKSKYSWFSESDSGQSDALNKGFANAKGEWLFWLNGDDVLLPNALDKVRNEIEKNPTLKWIAGNMIFINENHRIVKCVRSRGWKLEFCKLQVQVYGPTSFFKKDLFESVGGFDVGMRYAMDIDLWQRFKAKGIWFKKISEYLFGFRLHDESLTHSKIANRGAMRAEDMILAERYGLTYSIGAKLLARLIRLFDGSYFWVFIDTLRLRGVNVVSGFEIGKKEEN